MQKQNSVLLLSASDLVGHLHCRHLTGLDVEVASGRLAKPDYWDPFQEILQERGRRHEEGYIRHLKASGRAVTAVEGVGVHESTLAKTRAAMETGAEAIVQGAFRFGDWVGRTDVLLRVETPSALGRWSYEVVDAKLARETKGGTVLQLCLYSELLAAAQGARPETSYVVAPHSGYAPQPYRMDDFGAYYRRVRDSLAKAVRSPEPPPYPDPCEYCEICRWRERCDARRRADDHLALVAGATKVQTVELRRHGVETMAGLAGMPLPLAWKPARGAPAAYARIREQARIQVEGRTAGTMLHEFLPVEPGFGLARLPKPSPGDVFFDLEGDPFVGERGIEFLFGYAYPKPDGSLTYVGDWALTRSREKAAFELFVDFVVDRLKTHPDLHVYHYAPYEPAALKRLMGRYASREAEIDMLLRSRRFVDLFGVVRGALRASVESYSIKKLEPLYVYEREVSLVDANRSLFRLATHLELDDSELINEADLDVVAGYNRDDCLSTAKLRDWLEERRGCLIAQGVDVPRPEIPDGSPSERLGERQLRTKALIARLTADVPADVDERTPEQQARWLLAYCLDWHRREDKAVWWEFFRLCELGAEELMDERPALSGLAFLAATGGTTRAPIHRYPFPPQECEFRGGEDLHDLGGRKLGTVSDISIAERWVDIKKRRDSADVHPAAVFGHTRIDTGVLASALERIAEYIADHGVEGEGPYLAARDLLLRAPPRTGGRRIEIAGETALAAALRIAPALTGVLPIQGPPGAGKTYTGARMICALVAAGRKVGVTAVSHKVIHNLLAATAEAAAEIGVDLQCVRKPGDGEDEQPPVGFAKGNEALLEAIGDPAIVAGATAWFWARPDAADTVDVLFIDEAAQISLANVLAVSQAARSIVLLGDPQQLEQPMQASHPEGTDVSALHHLLHGEQTIRSDCGLFLAETWRLNPRICAFTSELFYERRLRSRPGLELQTIRAAGRLSGAGLRYLAVPSEGNQNSSPEEADCVRDIVREILASGATWVDKEDVEQPITLSDILIIAPYNAQVFELQERLPGARIGTVDKFQGQEAPIVVYSLTTSSYADAPRGMEFLYSLNRLNVATSRARCLCILVASPTVFEAQCRTPRQMQLANAFCRYLEMAVPA
jgi:predicted RecB family nuclease